METETWAQAYVNVPENKVNDFLKKMRELDLKTEMVLDELSEDQKAEIRASIAAYEKDPRLGKSWEEVKEYLDKKRTERKIRNKFKNDSDNSRSA